MKVFTVFLALSFSPLTLVYADERPDTPQKSQHAAFERIKALRGEWEVTHGGGEHVHAGATITYQITAGGSAVLETLFAGTDHEMITVYYMEGDQLALTHYCVLQNRPHMRAVDQPDADTILFRCPDQENAKIAAEDHMHQGTLTFVDEDHLKTDWVLYKDGKPDSTHSFQLARKKK